MGGHEDRGAPDLRGLAPCGSPSHTSHVSPRRYEADLHASLDAAVREAGDYFAGKGCLHETLHRLAGNLDAEGIPYALLGGMALGEHGYVRMTEDVDVLLDADGLARFQARFIGRGYVATHPGATRSFRDAESGVRIEVLVTGDYPGDGKPKPIAFPEPAGSAVLVDGLRVLSLPKLIELKLASGMSAPHRLRDLADVQEIIKVKDLDAQFGAQLDASVRERYLELERDVRTAGG
jgi:hypothetical protein